MNVPNPNIGDLIKVTMFDRDGVAMPHMMLVVRKTVISPTNPKFNSYIVKHTAPRRMSKFEFTAVWDGASDFICVD